MAATTLLVRDKTTLGDELNRLELTFSAERVTVRELIEARVLHEVYTYNAKAPPLFNGLVQPTEAEATLNGYSASGGKPLDAEAHVATALQGFRSSRFVLLVDGRQVEDLDEVLVLTSRSEVIFLKLIPLVGG